jgi:hypothetical protein
MDVREFLDSHGLTHLAEILAGFRDLQSLQTLASDEDALDALNLISRDAKKLLAAIRTIPSKTLSHGLPTVLALPLLEFEREANPVLALWAMCDFVELTLKLCVMAAAAEHSTLPEPMLRVFYNRIERPTLAAWHDMAQVASDHLLENSVLSKLPSTFAAIHQIIGSDAGSPASSVLSLRNRLAHARPTSTEATQWLKAWRRPLRSLVMDSLSWLREARFIAIEEHGQPCLLRDETGLELEEASPVPADATPGSAWLCLGDSALPLGLLAAFDFENRAPMVYMRTQDLGLHYLRIAPTGGVWESDLGSWHAFRDRFLKRQGPPAARTIRSFEEEILRESQRRIGRERELHELTEAVTRLKAGQCLWVGGTAGIGKSNLMAALMQRLLETPPENILVLPYRFRSQDDRNNRATFLTYFLEQLDLWECLRPHASGEEEREPESQTFASPQSSGPVMEIGRAHV